MFRLLVAFNLLVSPMTVPEPRVMTPGGDELGFAPVPRPYTGVHRLTGVLYAHDPVSRLDLLCGASVIRSGSRSLVLTAAHCLNHDGTPMRRVAFAPGFEDGRARLGWWRAVRMWVPRRWGSRPFSSRQLPYDVGVVGVARRGRTLEAVTGRGLRPAFLARGRTVPGAELLGYPIGHRYPGRDLYRCVGDLAEGGGRGPGVLVTRNCQAASGSSGGPAVRGSTVYGVISSSSPLADPAGFTVLSRLNRSLITQADHTMRHLPH